MDKEDDLRVGKISARDVDEFEKMFRMYFTRLAKYAYGYVKNVEIAKDLTQAVFLNIWELNGQWNPKGTIKSYLYKSVSNQCLNHIKHEGVREDWLREQKEEFEAQEFNQTHSVSSGNLEIEKLRDDLKKAISDMPEKRRKIFMLSRDEGLTYKEIAEVMGIKRKTVENQMGRALKHLREELQDWI